MLHRAVIGWALVLLLVSACGDDDTRGDAGAPPRFEELARSLEQERADLEAPGAAVAILEHGEVTYARGFGTSRPDGGAPVAATTLFRIGSLTKALTAVGLLQRVARGDVALDDPLTAHLPDFDFTRDASWAASITVEHLLTHSAAIVDYLVLDATPLYAGDDGLSDFLHGPFGQLGYLMAPPGRMYNYTNPGYMLLGLITETVSGQYYRDYLRDEVLVPLGMGRTYFLPAEVLLDGDYASGALADPVWVEQLSTPVVEPDTYDSAWGRPAGYAHSSVLDLAELVKFLRHGNEQVLDDSLREQMRSPRFDTETLLDLVHYGYGLLVSEGLFLGEDYYELTVISHAGAIPGYSAELFFFPDLDFGFITLANTDGAYFRDSLRVALQTLCALPAPVAPPDIHADPADHVAYEGTYDDPWSVGEVVVSRSGTELRLELPELDLAGVAYDPVLRPVARHNYRGDIQGHGFRVTFLLDAAGDAAYFRTRQFVAARTPAGAPPPPRPPPGAVPRLLRSLRFARADYGYAPGRR